VNQRSLGFSPPSEPNPCVRAFGPGPEEKRCKECAHLNVRRYSKNYYKCALRKETAGPATDHRVGWRGCAKFQSKEATSENR